MANTRDVIAALRERLPRTGVVTVFIGGSKPVALIAEHDLDVFAVVHDKDVNKFLDEAQSALDAVAKEFDVAWTLFKGPIKDASRGLIHFDVYTWENASSSFKKESPQFFTSFLATAETLFGSDVKQLIHSIPWATTEQEHREFMK